MESMGKLIRMLEVKSYENRKQMREGGSGVTVRGGWCVKLGGQKRAH